MVEYITTLDEVFHSLADPTRRDMLHRLRRREHTVGQLAAHYPLTFASISKHLRVLERARLVRKRKRGRETMVELSPKMLGVADAYLERYRALWERRLDRLETYLQTKK